MKPNEYQQLAMRTSNKALSQKEHVINAALGLCGEAGEVKRCADAMQYANRMDEFLSEVGDLCWYLAEMATALDIDLSEIFKCSVGYSGHDTQTLAYLMLLRVTEIADYVKKVYMQGHAMKREKLLNMLQGVAWNICQFTTGKYEVLSLIMENNIKKLERRYPAGEFSAERSINREAGDI